MSYKKIFFILVIVILISLGVYYRDYIPTTRSDFEGLYYYFIAKNDTAVIPSEGGGRVEARPAEQQFGRESLSDTSALKDSDNSIKRIERDPSAPAETASGQDDNRDALQNDNTKKSDTPANTVLPETVSNYVPFTPQAPYGVWDQLHEEACEEASLAMAHYFLTKRDIVLSKEADREIQDLTKYINRDDVSVGELKKVAENYYKHAGWKVIEKPNADDIKKELAIGNIIIVPLAGREVGNPYYKQPGPLYHMLVVSGYNDKKGVFITQDPGTKRGKNYEYKFQTLLNAIHDYTGDKNKIKEGVARILVVAK